MGSYDSNSQSNSDSSYDSNNQSNSDSSYDSNNDADLNNDSTDSSFNSNDYNLNDDQSQQAGFIKWFMCKVLRQKKHCKKTVKKGNAKGEGKTAKPKAKT